MTEGPAAAPRSSGAVVTRFWWLRHAPTVNPDGLLVGQSDLDADTGDAAALSGLAGGLPGDAVWLASPLQRARQTAAALLAAAGRAEEPTVVPALTEQSFGDWEARPAAAVYAGLGPDHPFWRGADGGRPPGGERFADVVVRVDGAIVRLASRYGGRDLVLVAHAGTIRAAVVVALDLAPDVALRLQIDTLSLTRLDRIATPDGSRTWRVVCVNRVASE